MASRRKIAIITGTTAAVVLAAGAGAFTLFGAGSSLVIPAAEVTTIAAKDLTTTVTASGTIAPVREVALGTTLTGPVATIDAQVGQRVSAQQVLATIDASATERELTSQRASQAANQIANMNQAEAAQLQLSQFQDALNQGLNPEINSATSALNSAQAAFDDAQRAADAAAAAAGTNTAATQEAAAGVASARSGLRTAHNQSLQAGLNALGTTAEGETQGTTMVASLLSWIEADASVSDAQRRVTEAEEAYARTLESTSREAADKQRAADAAYRQLTAATTALSAAQLSANNQIATQSQAVDHALEAAAGTSVAAEASNRVLEMNLAAATITSPINGIITAVNASTGRLAEGPLLTVADDSTLLLKTTVKEADISTVAVGNAVTFTTPSQPGKTFSGTVARISPVAIGASSGGTGSGSAGSNAGAGSGSGSGSGSTKAEFPVEIRITGDPAGLRLGSTAKAKITTSSQPNVRTVPLTALIEEEGTTSVLTIADGKINKRAVTISAKTDFEAVLATESGLHDGDRVITKPQTYLSQEGASVVIEEPAGAGTGA